LAALELAGLHPEYQEISLAQIVDGDCAMEPFKFLQWIRVRVDCGLVFEDCGFVLTAVIVVVFAKASPRSCDTTSKGIVCTHQD
jgi:hypothetical protein